MSTFGAILCVIAGLVEQAVIYTALGIDVDNVPAIVIIILWIFFPLFSGCCQLEQESMI